MANLKGLAALIEHLKSLDAYQEDMTLLEAEERSRGIDAKRFFEITGRGPEDDDLDRVNCLKDGPGHRFCGICTECGQPRFICLGEDYHAAQKRQKED